MNSRRCVLLFALIAASVILAAATTPSFATPFWGEKEIAEFLRNPHAENQVDGGMAVPLPPSEIDALRRLASGCPPSPTPTSTRWSATS